MSTEPEELSEHDKSAQAHARLLDAVAKRYNEATPEERKVMDRNLATAKAKAMGSVRGLRTLFPGLGRLSVTKEGMKNG